MSFSPLANSIMLLPHTGAVETAEPIRTMTMTMISEQKEKGMDGKVQKENEEVEEQNLVEEEKMIILNKQFESEEDKQISGNLEQCSRSSSISGISEQSDLSSSRYSSITQEDLQQELVVKAIKVKRKTKRRRQGKCDQFTVYKPLCST